MFMGVPPTFFEDGVTRSGVGLAIAVPSHMVMREEFA
jgi:hypothetical protein